VETLLKEAWTLAIETLSWIEMQNLSEHLALARTIKQLNISNPDAVRFGYRLVCETIRRKNLIDEFANSILKPKTIDEFNLGVQAFLRLYIYQTRITKRWSKIDLKEAEQIAKMARSILGWKTLWEIEPFLGYLLTEKPEPLLKGVSDEEKVGLLTFQPTWLVEYCFKLFGRRESIVLFEASVHPPPTYIRLNTLGASESEIFERLVEDGIKLEKIAPLRHAYKLVGAKQPLTRTASFREGLFYVQDKASCFAAEAANPKPGMTVLDVCSAPGAKTTYIAQLMQNQGRIYSIDYSKRRMKIWKNEVACMGVEVATPILSDARHSLPFPIEADLVVLDPPCTSTGAFGKLPSAKWRLTPNSIDKMAELQWKMINNCAENVKLGGTIVYSTCSVTVEENEVLVERFLKWHPEFSLSEISPKIGLPGLRGMEKCQRLYPHIHQCNGFFMAKLQKEQQIKESAALC